MLRMRYIIGVLVAIGLVVLLIVLLFSGGGSKPQNSKSLSSYANSDAVARLTIDGPEVSQQDHHQVQIEVSRDSVTFRKIQGYDGQVLDTRNYDNSLNSYSVFLHALAHAGFTKGNTDPSMKDERGNCALGERYIFELQQDGNDIVRFWSTSCGSPKTYGGNTALTLGLFQKQVPDYNDLVSNFQLSD